MGLSIDIPLQPRLFSLASNEMVLAGTKEKTKCLKLSFRRDQETSGLDIMTWRQEKVHFKTLLGLDSDPDL